MTPPGFDPGFFVSDERRPRRHRQVSAALIGDDEMKPLLFQRSLRPRRRRLLLAFVYFKLAMICVLSWQKMKAAVNAAQDTATVSAANAVAERGATLGSRIVETAWGPTAFAFVSSQLCRSKSCLRRRRVTQPNRTFLGRREGRVRKVLILWLDTLIS